MSRPLETPRSRRAGVIIAFWIVAGGSIVVSNTQDLDGLVAYLAIFGEFYTWAHTALADFAANATVPEWIVLATYLVLTVVVLVVIFVLLTQYTFSEYNYELFAVLLLPVLVIISAGIVSLPVLFGTVNLPVADALWLLLSMGPQTLVLSIMFLLISFVSAYVP